MVKDSTRVPLLQALAGYKEKLHYVYTDISASFVDYGKKHYGKENPYLDFNVLDIEKESERFSLGIKQLQDDPWTSVAERYQVGKEITGTITNLTDFGVFVELEEGIEGLVHVSEISKEKIKTPVGMFNIGDVITARVMNINSDERRIGLSIKRMEIEDEQSLLSDYVNNISPATSTFGEILRENLQEKLNED